MSVCVCMCTCDVCMYCLHVCAGRCVQGCVHGVCMCVGGECEGECVFSLPGFRMRLRQPGPLAGQRAGQASARLNTSFCPGDQRARGTRPFVRPCPLPSPSPAPRPVSAPSLSRDAWVRTHHTVCVSDAWPPVRRGVSVKPSACSVRDPESCGPTAETKQKPTRTPRERTGQSPSAARRVGRASVPASSCGAGQSVRRARAGLLPPDLPEGRRRPETVECVELQTPRPPKASSGRRRA